MPSDTYTLTISDVGVSTPADLSVTTAKIVDLNVKTGKIADSAITSAKIANGTIVEADIADSAITSAKIANGTIVAGDIADGAITSAKILDGTIAAVDIADGAVTTDKIGTGTIVNNNIASNTITLGKIATIGAGTILGNATAGTTTIATSPCTAFGFQMLAAADVDGGKTVLGLGSMATQASSAVSITGGTIANVAFSGTSVNVSSPTGTLPVANGGTGFSSYIAGQLLYANGATSFGKLEKGASTNYVLHGAGVGTAPSWGFINLATDVTGVLPATNGGTGLGGAVDTFSFLTTGQTTDALETGELRWNSTDKTLDLKLAGDVTLQVGQESNIYAHNSQGGIIPNGSVVYIYGADGSNPAVKLATNADISAKKTLGIATQEIAIGQHGYITTQGLVRTLDTSAYVSGDVLYLGTGGALTATEPTHPANVVRMAIVVADDVTNGSIYVQPQLFSDGRVSGTFVWGTTANAGTAQTVVGLTATSEVIIQQRGVNPAVQSFYSVVCNTDSFTPYATAAGGGGALPIATTGFSYIAFI
jgi:hypothetical protein